MPCGSMDTFWCHARAHPGWFMMGLRRGIARGVGFGFDCGAVCGGVDAEASADGRAVTGLVIVAVGAG
jgi:hypothetical protein